MDQDMEVAVVDLSNGHTDKFLAPPTFSFHHANAFNVDEGKFALDLCPTAYSNYAEIMLLENIVFPTGDQNETESEPFTR